MFDDRYDRLRSRYDADYPLQRRPPRRDVGDYGGMRSDAHPESEPLHRLPPRGEFGWGGGTYDAEYPPRDRSGSSWSGHTPAQRSSALARAADIMTERPTAVTPDDPIGEAARLMRELDVGILPVIESQANRRLVGVVTDRDIAVRAVAEDHDASTPVAECMSEDPETIRSDETIRRAMETMGRARIRRLPVVDDRGRLIGIVSQADLAVDYAGFDPEREREVERMLERVSEPARPRRRESRGSGTAYASRPGNRRDWMPFEYW